MARMDLAGLDDVFDQLTMAGEGIDETAQQMLEAGAGICVEAWKRSIGSHGHVKTGDMQRSVGVKYKKKNGALSAEIYPLGKDRKGVRNAEKAFVLHYGRSNITGSRFVDDAEAEAEQPAADAMQEVWNKRKEGG